MDRVSSNIIINDFNKGKGREMTKLEEWKKTFDTSLFHQLTDEEVDDLLLERAKYRLEKYPVIKLNKEMSYRCVDCEEGYILQYKWWEHHEWNDVTDVSEMKIWEYNDLVDKLNKHYPDYPIEHLEGRFV